jgi:hypothetical protein
MMPTQIYIINFRKIRDDFETNFLNTTGTSYFDGPHPGEILYENYSAELKMSELFYLNLYEKLKSFISSNDKENASNKNLVISIKSFVF